MKIRIKRFDKDLPLPVFDEFEGKTGQENASKRRHVAGFDLFCREDITIPPHEIRLVGINNVIEVPLDCFMLLVTRSSTPLKRGLMLANGAGVIDPFYSGDKDEIRIQLLNFTDKPVKVRKGEVLVQGLILKREPVEWEEVASMGEDGHGGYLGFPRLKDS